uniref:RNA helicase n=1 Tax=Panagrellus redivivus TaxID=6233 RepID=A0A7E4UVG4_PANRE
MSESKKPANPIREADRLKIINSAPKPIAEVALRLLERIENHRRNEIGNAIKYPASINAKIIDEVINFTDEDTVTIRSETELDSSDFNKGVYIYLHDSRDYFVQKNYLLCSVTHLQPYEFIARIIKQRSKPNWLDYLKHLKTSRVTVRFGVHHAPINVFDGSVDAVKHVLSEPDLFEKLVYSEPTTLKLTNMPDFLGYKHIELPQSIYDNVPTFFPEQKSAINALTRQTSDTFVLAGAPGTGKTFVLVEAALRLILAGARVLFISTYYKSADAVSREFVKRGLTDRNLLFRALGSNRDASDLSADCMKFSETIKMPPITNGFTIDNCSIVITTFCLLFKTCLINNAQPFTHVFIDDAQHVCEISIWDALHQFGHKNVRFVLCGNPYSDYLDSIMELEMVPTPLFRIASDSSYNTNPNLMITLTENHRSHKAIVDILARLCYEDNLKTADTDKHNALCNWEYLPNPDFPVLFHNVDGKVKKGINQAEADVVIKYLTSLRHIVSDDDIRLSCDTEQKALIRTHFKPEVDRMSNLFEASYPRVYLVSRVHNKNWRVSDDEDGYALNASGEEDEDKSSGNISENEIPKVKPFFDFNPNTLNFILSRTRELVIVVGHAETWERKPAWKQFIDYCRENNSYIE